jgi:hypothetical protein
MASSGTAPIDWNGLLEFTLERDPDVIALEEFEQLPDAFAVDVERTREAAERADSASSS